ITTILQALNVVVYLYLKSIDRTITPVYAGLHLASTKTGHALGTILFAVYAYSAKSFKSTLLIGRAVSMFSLVLYLIILIFPEHLRCFVLLTAFGAQLIAEGSLIIIRSFVPRVSTKKDRQAAYGIVNGAMMMSILAGPGIQFAVTSLPEFKAISWLQFIPFTYPIWTSLLLCIIATVIICVRMTEPAPIRVEEEEEAGGSICVSM
ncbi:hypothetical protein PENTCL1PPCAC_4924, partial [Pristionchus entomophagus]